MTFSGRGSQLDIKRAAFAEGALGPQPARDDAVGVGVYHALNLVDAQLDVSAVSPQPSRCSEGLGPYSLATAVPEN